MISFQQAIDLVMLNTIDFGIEAISLIDSTGRILASDVVADRDFPPYDRVTMDGISINIGAYENGKRKFVIEKMQAAGAPQQKLDNPENCIEVMTGSILPENTNAVVPYEQCEIKDGIATIVANNVMQMQNIHAKQSDCRQGASLVKRNEKITASTVALMASVGLAKVEVKRCPKVAVCTTGNELVDVTEQPQPHQTRRSNSYMLAAELRAEQIYPTLHHLADDEEQMNAAIEQLLNSCDVLLLSGAVSKGKFDFLPNVLKRCGMQTIFHGVVQRPGKPFLFGKFSGGQMVFAFPGNPVSTFVCYHKYFKPWLYACLNYNQPVYTAILSEDFLFKPGITLHLLVLLDNVQGMWYAKPVNTSTSGDMVQLEKANAIMTLPSNRENFKKGEVFSVTWVC